MEALRNQIRSSTSSMTSVPKPLKFLRPHYAALVDIHKAMASSEDKRFMADIMSVLSMTSGAENQRDTLRYKLEGSTESISVWGHEYVR